MKQVGDIDKTVEGIKSAAGTENISKSKPATGNRVEMQCMQHLDVNSVVDATMEKFGRIDMLINNAGILQYKNLLDMSEEGWANTINVNLAGAFLFCKAVLPHMVKSNSGVIINVSSGGGKMGFPKMSAY